MLSKNHFRTPATQAQPLDVPAEVRTIVTNQRQGADRGFDPEQVETYQGQTRLGDNQGWLTPSRRRPAQTAPTPVSEHKWSGFYVGGTAGFSFAHENTALSIVDPAIPNCHFRRFPEYFTTDIASAEEAGSPSLAPKGFTGGGQFGVNWQASHQGEKQDINRLASVHGLPRLRLLMNG